MTVKYDFVFLSCNWAKHETKTLGKTTDYIRKKSTTVRWGDYSRGNISALIQIH
jgi:hypothetical protein